MSSTLIAVLLSVTVLLSVVGFIIGAICFEEGRILFGFVCALIGLGASCIFWGIGIMVTVDVMNGFILFIVSAAIMVTLFTAKAN